MITKIMKVALLAAFGLFASYNVYNAQQSETISDIALANVEALAWIEEPSEWCTECEPCVDEYNVCITDREDFLRDAHRNCSYLDEGSINYLMC